MFGVLLELAEDYNVALNQAKDAMRDCKTKTPLPIGDFHRAKDTDPVTTYRPDLMPNSYLLVPGVIKEVDAKRVAELVKNGSFDPDSLKKAKGSKPGRAPAVRGPKEISVLL